MPRGLFWKLLVCCLLLAIAAAGRASPAVGVVISNTALATFVDQTTGMSVRISSDTVKTRVSALEALTLTAPQSVLVATSAPFTTSHVLTNTGNTVATFQVTATLAAGSAFTPTGLQVVQDLNGNGSVDAGEPVVPAAGIELPVGGRVYLLVTGRTPATGTAGQRAQVTLTATSTAQGARASNTDAFTLTGGPAVQVVLSASVAATAPSEAVTWTADVTNSGAGTAAPQAITVDGANSTGFVVRIPVPANVGFEWVAPPANPSTRTLYHLAGAASSTYVTAAPAGVMVDAIAWALPELAAGASMQGKFRVRVNGNAAGTIGDTAYVDWVDQGKLALATSNTVWLPLPPRSARVEFYVDNTYVVVATQDTPGKPLYVQADAAICNADPVRVDTVPVSVVSQLTGDIETYTAVETGPNTGVFRIQPEVPTANAKSHVVAFGDGILEVLRNDLVTATIAACGGISASALTTLLIDPSGVVYDSRSNLPVPNATVELIDVTGQGNGGRPGQLATVLQLDGVTPAASRVVTAGDGVYLFPLVQPSTYQLRVTPPDGLAFPSQLPADLQPAGRLIDTPGSFGGTFRVTTGAVRFDVPLDTGGSKGLLLQKTAGKTSADVGDFVDYTIKLNNTLAVPLPKVTVQDVLPAGFAYVPGTARLEGKPMADPAGGTGPQLTFSVGNLDAGAQPAFTYRVRIGAGAQSGNGINTAQATGGGVASNRATARVQVTGGVFATDAYLIGKVFADCKRDGVQTAGEPGIPGVRIYLEDGTYAVTDEEGKYSLYGLSPRTHVAKVDRTTLPAGAALVVIDHLNAGDGGSRFVDLRQGELQKADFAIGDCDEELRGQIGARRKALGGLSEMAQAAGLLLSSTAPSAADGRTLPASGTVGLPGAAARGTTPADKDKAEATAANASLAPGATGDAGGPVGREQQGLPKPQFTPVDAQLPSRAAGPGPAPAAVPAEDAMIATPLEELLAQLTPETGFLGLQDGQVLAAPQTRVRVKGPLGATFELLVNGQPVPVTQVGKRSSLEQKGVSAWEYIGVDLRPGRNALEVRVHDGFGNVRGKAQLTLLAPGALAGLRFAPPQRPVADPETPLAVTLSLHDADGVPVAARTQVTLQAGAGRWLVNDSDPRQPGLQVMVEGGSARLMFQPPAQPGKVELSAVAGNVTASVDVDFAPKLRPMVAAGIVEGAINLRNLNLSSLQPATSGDVFEREIRSVSRSFDGGKGEIGARAAVFLKGKVLGSTLLTLAYDSDKPGDTRLFRDIQPNRFYPVYGDSSVRGFDGQSTGHLYVLLQNGSDYALVGDFTTQTDNAARQLTQYSRALNGGKGHWSNGTVTVDGFASRTAATQVVQEFRGNGTSGPFQLNRNGVANSEQVHVITRSREQPALVLKDTALAPFSDYAIEGSTGLLLLKAPVASVDADLNPLFVRITYDVDNGGPRHDVAGVEASVQVLPGVTVGAVAVRDQDPANRQTLTGLTVTGKLADKTVVNAEIAHSETDLQGSGKGERVELKHESAGLQVRAWGAHTDASFYNPNSPQSAGQSQYGAKLAYNLDAANRIVGEAQKTTNSTTGADQVSAELKLEHSLPGNAVVEVGVRHAKGNAQGASTSAIAPGAVAGSGTTPTTTTPGASSEIGYTSVRAKLTVPVPGMPKADAYAVAEQAVDGSGGREVGIGANYTVDANTRAYVRHDFVNSLTGPAALTTDASRYTTVAGVNTVLPENTQLFNEYRLADAVDGRTAEAALGLRKTLRLWEGFNATGSLQRIKPLRGPRTDDSTAIAVGADYTAAATWRASGQLQWQESTTSRSWLASAALVQKLDAEWTLLNRLLLNEQANHNANGGARRLVTAQSGVAFRPVDDDRVNALARIEYKRDQDTTAAPARDQSSWIFSTHANVQPNSAWLMSGRYAARWLKDGASGLSTRSFTQLLGARSTWDLGERWSVGLQAYRMWSDGAAETAIGVEVGYLVWKNLWLAGGYNVKGFAAGDLAGDARTMRGAYLRLRYKFDESLFDGAGHADAQSAATQPAAAAPLQ